MVRIFYLGCGVVSLLAGIIGIFLPLLPTTPFVILSAFCFSKSSKTLHQKLISHRIFGPIIDDWERYGVIPFKVKLLSTSMMLVMVSYPFFFGPLTTWMRVAVALTVVVALAYIWTRPSVPKESALNPLSD